MQIEKYKYDKWTTVSLYQSHKGSLTIIGSKVKYAPQALAVYKELLLLSNTSIIIRVVKDKGRIHLKNILLKSLHYYNKQVKDKPSQNGIKNSINDINSIHKSDQSNKSFSWVTALFIIGFLILILVFVYDFNSIKLKINQSNISKANELKAEYSNNNCIAKGNLPALREFCQKILREIEELNTQCPTIISIFFMWVLDIFNNGYSFIGISNVIVTILIILLIRKLI